MAFFIQDPTFSKSSYLHEALISSCVGGVTGGGAYAFASKDGIELLIEDDNFKQFLKTGQFTLIVGMDDITNIYSVETLKRMQEKYTGHLIIKAYIHNSKGSTFHPKYSWFAKPDGGSLVIGSGNLTQKGLRQNREAYAIETMTPEETFISKEILYLPGQAVPNLLNPPYKNVRMASITSGNERFSAEQPMYCLKSLIPDILSGNCLLLGRYAARRKHWRNFASNTLPSYEHRTLKTKPLPSMTILSEV